MHKNAAKLLGLYILGVIGYAFFVSRFTIPVHLTVDEELYISMARSFHYQGHFSQGGILLDYTCVLYSMLLSLAVALVIVNRPKNPAVKITWIILIMLAPVFAIPFYLFIELELGHRLARAQLADISKRTAALAPRAPEALEALRAADHDTLFFRAAHEDALDEGLASDGRFELFF